MAASTDLGQIMAELNPVYDPMRASNQQQQAALDPQLQSEQQGLDATKQSAFSDITQQANRNGLFYSGIPIAEQQKYVGGNYLPAVANLHAKYDQQRFGLHDALAKIQADQSAQAYGIQNDRQKAQDAAAEFDRQLAATTAAQKAGASSGLNFGNSGAVLGAQGTNYTAPGAGMTLRQTWQREANQGDWNAQVALNYAGDNGRYDGAVNSQAEYDILKNIGIQGNYFVANNNKPIPIGNSAPTVVPWAGSTPSGYSGLQVVNQ